MLKLSKMARAVKEALRDWWMVPASLEPENLVIDPPAVKVRVRRG